MAAVLATTLAATPATAVALGGPTDVTAGGAETPRTAEGRHSGTVAAWGLDGEFDAANVPAGLTGVVEVDAHGYSAAALRADGSAVAWTEGYDDYDLPGWVAGLSDVSAIAMGGAHVLALLSDGSLVARGWDRFGQSTPPPDLEDVVAIDAGGAHNLALRADGKVVAWGDDDDGESTVPDGLTDVVALSAGSGHSLALRADGTVSGWGDDRHGQATPPVGLDDVVAISAGNDHSVALHEDGTVTAWGHDDYATVPSGISDVVEIAADQQTMALRGDGTIVVWGSPWAAQWGGSTTVPQGLGGVHAVATGGPFNFVVVDPAAQGPLPDTTGPEIRTKGFITKAATSGRGARIWFAPAAVDAVFGPIDPSCGWYRGEWHPLGTTEVRCDATDWAGNTSEASYKVRVTWSWSGLLPPFAADGVSTFDHGQVVPVHFKLTKGSHGADDARATLTWAPVIDGIVGERVPVTDAAGGGSQLAWDGWKYVMEWDTGTTPGPGAYSLAVDLGDGVERTTLVRLR